MTIQTYTAYIGDDDEGQPIYSERSYDDGENQTYQQYLDAGTSDADLAGGLLTPDAMAAVLGKDNVDYNAWMKESMTPEAQAAVQKMIASGANSSTIGKLLNGFKTANGAYDWAKIATAGAGLTQLLKNESGNTGGYNVPVPKLDVVRQQIAYNDTNRRPGAAGRQYFTDPRFVKQGDAESLANAKEAAAIQAQGILAAAPKYAAPVTNYNAAMKAQQNVSKGTQTGAATEPTATLAGLTSLPNQEQLMNPNYKIGMASGGIASARYLQGGTDGMADKIPAHIDGEQPAALSHGEFVIPADVVSHLGNGNSEAGADKLYQMMARIRKARTGNEKQGKQINPDKFMPGGLASAYAAGGSVKGFDGNSGSLVSNTATSAGGVPLDTSKTSTLSPWVGDYVTNFLGQGAALANAPQQVYQGPLTAGASDLQNKVFQGLGDVTFPTNLGQSFSSAGAYASPSALSGSTNPAGQVGNFNPNVSGTGITDGQPAVPSSPGIAAQYMNPYLQSVLDPQLAELRRQNDITNMKTNAGLTTQGAFGGGRNAIMNAENNRNMMQEMNKTVGQGYANAYDKAMGQFNIEQGQAKTLADLLAQQGSTQRNIESEGIAADKAQFEQQQAYPFNMVEFQRKLVEGLPIGASTTAVNQDTLSKLQSDVSGLASLYKTLANLGLKTP